MLPSSSSCLPAASNWHGTLGYLDTAEISATTQVILITFIFGAEVHTKSGQLLPVALIQKLNRPKRLSIKVSWKHRKMPSPMSTESAVNFLSNGRSRPPQVNWRIACKIRITYRITGSIFILQENKRRVECRFWEVSWRMVDGDTMKYSQRNSRNSSRRECGNNQKSKYF